MQSILLSLSFILLTSGIWTKQKYSHSPSNPSEQPYITKSEKKHPKKNKMFRPGQLWLDNRGMPINAHGGGIMKYKNTYYWFGEHKSEYTSKALIGITCYSSKDLYHWTYRGIALSVSSSPGDALEKGCIMERPKVIYNKKTKKFVMWFHLELKGQGYAAARYAVAIADTPVGPYRFLYSARSNAGKYPLDMTSNDKKKLDSINIQEWLKSKEPDLAYAAKHNILLKRDMPDGQMSRDMTLFVDDDGKAYHIFASEENYTLHIAQLTEDYTHHNGKYVRVAIGGQNEAPAIFKKNNTYWMITSGCTGWSPNKARMFSASNIMGPWKQYETPCQGPRSAITFGGQSTFILPYKKHYIFMADVWRPKHPIDARYIWLPITSDSEKPKIVWRDAWSLNLLNQLTGDSIQK